MTLPDPQLDLHRAVVRELVPHRRIRLAVGDLAEGGAVDPGPHPPLDDDVVDELGEGVVPAADRHVPGQRGEVGVDRLAVVEVGPHPVVGLGDAAVEVPDYDERHRPLGGRVDLALQDGDLLQEQRTVRAGRGVLEAPALEVD